ncbi:hypothetical protein [Streptomyces phage JXY1]|uniref:Uncharacterized protein n=2 Tax=Manuelvirus JXY1 TaxID=2846400 RepID=A0A6C0RUG9_9CAUD|nr:hypothetical protein HWD10_gp01 [Streptomyces phage JXY1]QIA28794.1 hypothetical protein [Streptomyces phage JXY1]QNN98964.1 hypothetical protein SEA_ZEIGLE_42 [Streptomyces phage Zeigle]WNA15450.1 tail tube protein [Streptomyces phage Kumquat]
MAVTFANIVDRTKQQLLGYTKDQAAVSYLVEPMTATSTQFHADEETITNLSRGLVEIGDELILVKKYDRTSGIVTVMGGNSGTGRGVDGTTAVAHAIDEFIINDPRFPRQRIKEAINDTINGLYPDLWVFGQYEFPYRAARYEYPVPEDVDDVYKVVINTIGPSGVWFPAQSWRFNPMSSTTSGQVKPTPTPTGKSIQIYDRIVPGRNVRVSYTKKPDTLVNNDDDFETVTGFPERYVDMITYGAAWRLLPAYEAGRLQQASIEATERAPLVPTQAATQASQFFLALYQKRLSEERARLQRLYESYQTFNG